MTPRRSWIQDYCEDGNWPADEQHAQGLLKLHATCIPACPRKLSAQRWLRECGTSSEPDNTAGDG